MPTVLRTGPYRVYFHSHEAREPAHVHIDREAMSAKFWIDPISLARNVGYSAHELHRLFRLVEEHRTELLDSWNGYFGDRR